MPSRPSRPGRAAEPRLRVAAARCAGAAKGAAPSPYHGATLAGVVVAAPALALPGTTAAPASTTILKVPPGRIVRMYAHPHGRLLFRVLPKTAYGRRLILSVTQQRGAWAAVP